MERTCKVRNCLEPVQGRSNYCRKHRSVASGTIAHGRNAEKRKARLMERTLRLRDLELRKLRGQRDGREPKRKRGTLMICMLADRRLRQLGRA